MPPHISSPWRSPSQWTRRQTQLTFNRAGRCPDSTGENRDLAMISLDFNFNILTRDLSHYLENQVKVGLFGSGVGLSLVLGFSAAYTCYYLISVAKVRTVNVCFATTSAFMNGQMLFNNVYVKSESLLVLLTEEHHLYQASNGTRPVHFADGGFDQAASVRRWANVTPRRLHMWDG